MRNNGGYYFGICDDLHFCNSASAQILGISIPFFNGNLESPIK